MSKKIKMLCPLCNTLCTSKEDIIIHFKKTHPEVNTLNFGGEKINIKEVD